MIQSMVNAMSMQSIVIATKEQVSCDLDGEIVILDLKNGIYYGLDAIGARIWNMLQEPQTVGAIRDAILLEYDVEPERCGQDLLGLLRDMGDKGLVETRNETAT
ncbi:MAG: PqqD family protein [Anaerolineae bacterium]|nr:PqqD family protein [Anaerolineae bacterium]